jgi:hypothetical protein
MADPTHTPYGLVYGVDAFGRPLTAHDLAAASPNPVRVAEPIPLTSPIAQWKNTAPEPQTQPQSAQPGPAVRLDPYVDPRRAQFAGQVFASLVVHSGANASDSNLSRMAQLSVRAADLLLVELDKPTR